MAENDDDLNKVSTPRGEGRSLTPLGGYDVRMSMSYDGRSPPVNSTGGGADWMGPLQPMLPVAPPEVAGRVLDFIPGYNLTTTPRFGEPIPFPVLRMLAETYDPLRLIIERRKDQMCRLPWKIRYKHHEEGKKRPALSALPKAKQKRLADLNAFFNRPDREVTFRSWLRAVLEDLLVLDAPSIYCERNRGGGLIGLRYMDGSCYSDDTEVLTRRGWLNFSKVTERDEFATRNIHTKQMEWQRATYFHEVDYVGPMYHFSSRAVDVLVSPNHRMLVSSPTRTGAREQVFTARELAEKNEHRRYSIPMTSTWRGNPVGRQLFALEFGQPRPMRKPVRGAVQISCIECESEFSVHPYRKDTALFCSEGCRWRSFGKLEMSGDDYCAFMGMYLAEGSGNDRDVYITQLPKSKGFVPFKALIERITGAPALHTGTNFVIGRKALRQYLKQFGTALIKYIPQDIMDATPQQLRLFWDYYVAGDGTNEAIINNRKGREFRQRIYTSSRRMADQLVEVAQKLGWSASIGVRVAKSAIMIAGQRPVPVENLSDNYVVNVRYSDVMTFNVDRQIYAGKIRCVSVPNEFLYVRRNGKPAWCGNTIKRVIDDWGRTPEPVIWTGQPFMWDGSIVTFENHQALGFKIMPGAAARHRLPIGMEIPDFVMMPPAYQQCYAADMDILTKSGWKQFEQLTKTDEVATRNPSTKAFEWQQPTNIIRNRYRGKMYGFKSRFLDLLVTPEHRMLVSRLPRALGGSPYRERGEAIVTAEELANNYTISTRIPLTSEWTGSDIGIMTFARESAANDFDIKYAKARDLRSSGLSYEKIGVELGIGAMSAHRACNQYAAAPRERSSHEGKVITMSGDDYAAFMGAYLSEGSCNLYNGKTVNISQMPDGKAFADYQDLLDRIAPDRVKYYEPNFVLYSASVVDHLKKFGHARTKWVPDEIMNASRRQLEIFWKFFWLGDGDTSRQRVFTSSRRMADQLQEIAQKIGLSASMRITKARTSEIVEGNTVRQIASGEMYTVSILPHSESAITEIVTEEYDGDVWCVSVPNTIVYVRRNGKAAWCGNCLHGLPAVNYTTSDLIYRPLNLRPGRLFGMSPVEMIVTTVNIALRRNMSQLEYYREGNQPESIYGLPVDWNPDQVQRFQDYWDNLFVGNLGARRRMKFLPGGANNAYTALKEPPLKSEMDEWLIRIVCFALSYPPQAFVALSNRSTAEQHERTAEEEGVEPLKNWLTDLVNEVLETEFPDDDVEFVFSEEDEIDQTKQKEILTGYAEDGMLTVNQVRERIGEEKDPNPAADRLMVKTALGFVPIEANIREEKVADAKAMQAVMPKEPPPGKVPSSSTPSKTDDEE